MALLGVQLVITLVMISVMQKLGPHFSIARWLLCSTGLVRYLYPTDSELRQAANVPKDKQKGKKGSKSQSNGTAPTKETFHIPKNIDIDLDTIKVSPLDVIHLRFYMEYQWLLDFSIYAAVVYIATEVYHGFFPSKDEVNLSMLWIFLVIIFASKMLLSLTIQYFKGEESVGERSTCIVMGFVYFLLSMMVLIVDENTLEVGLETAYSSFNQSASAFLNKQGLSSNGPISKLILKLCMALWCGVLGAFFTFPGLRIARMHWDLLKYYQDRRFIQLLLNLAYALPFLLVIAWIKPVSRDYLTVRIFKGFTEPLLTASAFDTLRIVLIIVTMILKTVLMPLYLQAYLDMAKRRVEELKKEAGRITNVDFQKQIAAVFYYLCVVTLQYIAPLVMCLYMAMMYKTLGGYSWNGMSSIVESEAECSIPEVAAAETAAKTITENVQEFHLALDSLKTVFTQDVFRGLFGFSTWWCCFLYFATTSLGICYQTYFTSR
ncbi:PREDICTED: transmembrane protein 161B [Nicrophorus vespilloides]|uniref:Transmembrane protein 161B n=1 Tax=Nicrophorus vespilloides TaxID=110193 RepID=A0ABM1MX20_NICVS|nr:PREDICTED: transmembrane protein 161B [Nicrophorus vespilloides]